MPAGMYPQTCIFLAVTGPTPQKLSIGRCAINPKPGRDEWYTNRRVYGNRMLFWQETYCRKLRQRPPDSAARALSVLFLWLYPQPEEYPAYFRHIQKRLIQRDRFYDIRIFMEYLMNLTGHRFIDVHTPRNKISCGHSRFAFCDDIAERTPNRRAS